MNTSTMVLVITSLIAVSIIFLLIQILLRKIKRVAEIEGKLKISYGIWFTTLFLAAVFVITKTIISLGEAINNIYKINVGKPIVEIAKTSSLFIGFGAMWFLICYLISNIFSMLITGNRKQLKEMEADNYTYFLIKGISVVGFVTCLSPVFETILRAFMPSIQIPFYH